MSLASAPFHKEGRMDVEAGSKPPVDSSPHQRETQVALGELLQGLGAAQVCRAGFMQMRLGTSSHRPELLLLVEKTSFL